MNGMIKQAVCTIGNEGNKFKTVILSGTIIGEFTELNDAIIHVLGIRKELNEEEKELKTSFENIRQRNYTNIFTTPNQYTSIRPQRYSDKISKTGPYTDNKYKIFTGAHSFQNQKVYILAIL